MLLKTRIKCSNEFDSIHVLMSVIMYVLCMYIKLRQDETS